MRHRQGVLWGEDFAQRISTERFVVHSGFHTVLNLQADPAKPLLSLVTCLEAMGPNALLVTGGPGLETFEIASALSFEANSLRVGPLSIDCSQVKRPSLISRSDGQKRGVQRRVRKWVEAQAPGLTSVRSHLTNQLAEGLLTEDEDLVRSALAGFIGQGMGLTPSGDDFVAGVLLAYVKGFQLQDLQNTFISRLPVLVEEVWWRTTGVSQTMLWYAARGAGANYLAEMAEALYQESGLALEIAARLWKIGASSGRHLLAGVLLGNELFNTREGSKISLQEKIIVRSNTYADSVTLMVLSQKLQQLDGVSVAMVGMGTPLNLDLLQGLKFEAVEGGVNDLIIAIRAASIETLEKALSKADELLNKGGKKASEDNKVPIKSLGQALERQDSNLVLISVPGVYAAREAGKALKENLNVMLFSDSVSLEDEVMLKKIAHEKGLLLMGPDCGTAIINGVPLAFANSVRRGGIGVVGASGTGTQEVTVQIDRMGEGLSQVIGTGGRDLKEAVGGIMMLDGIELLKQDPATKVILVVSKPAAPAVADKVFQALQECGKPAVLYVIGAKGIKGSEKVHLAKNLLEASQIAVELSGGSPIGKVSIDHGLVHQTVQALKPQQKYVRGLFSGGTLCDETMEVLTEKIGLIYSNGPLNPLGQLENPNKSVKNTILDLGDDFFTVGRPHPMIDSSLRVQRLEQEAKDQEVALILLDIVLGYGSNMDPASDIIPAIVKARQIAAETQREIVFVAYVCGSPNDPQGYEKQTQQFRNAGVLMFKSNVEAAEFSAAVLGQIKGGDK
ncbi:MAG TPA: hypothetical protein DD730_00230 [Desulfosporosinus sp.]|nr:hypothetical protein [Desulfosporosinus sp.]